MTSSLTPHTAPSISRHEHERPLTESHHDLHAQTFRWSRDSPLVDLVSDPSFSSSQSPATPPVSSSLSAPPVSSTPPFNLVPSDSDATGASIIPLTVTVTEPLPSVTPLAASIHPTVTTTLTDFQVKTVCIGHGVDAQSIGLLSTLAVPSVVGVGIWVSRPSVPVPPPF